MTQVPFSPPDITEEDIAAVADTLRSGWITTGPKTKLFEERIARYISAPKAAAMSSQTAAAEMTLRVLGIGEGDEVIVPAYTYTATASVVYHVGAKPIIIDCAKDSYEMDYEKLSEAITPATKAVIPVDIAGVMCDYKKIFEIVEDKRSMFTPSNSIQEAIGRVVVLADTAHSLGAVSEGIRSGAAADFSAFSFHAVKNLTTGEGGMAVWKSIPGIDDKDIYQMYMLYSLHGQTKDALAKSAGNWEYDIIGPYFKCNMTDILASLGLSQLNRYDQMLTRRHEIVQTYDMAFKKLPVTPLLHSSARFRSSAHLYMVTLPAWGEENRNEIIRRMADDGIACNVHYKPLPLLTAYKRLGFDIADYPNAMAMYTNEVTLPLYSTLTDEQVEWVIESFAKAVGQ